MSQPVQQDDVIETMSIEESALPASGTLPASIEQAPPPAGVRLRHVSVEDIARRAHEIYEARGASEGADLDDWLRAESELLGAQLVETEPS